MHLQYERLASTGATEQLHQVLGARLQSGKRVSISNPNRPRDEPAAFRITSNPTTYRVFGIGNTIHRRSRPVSFSSAVLTAHRIRGNKVARRVFAPVFPRLVHVDDKPTLGLFAAGVDQSDHCITLKLLLCWNYTYIWHSKPFLQEACRGPTGKRNTNLETLCLPKWRGILTGLRG